MTSSLSRVLSIQSHVVHGYVGNKSATFPLQLLGFEVDCINSVQLSNHTGYKVFKGQILDENDLTTGNWNIVADIVGDNVPKPWYWDSAELWSASVDILHNIDFLIKNDLFSGLKENGLDVGYSHLLTGYVRNKSFLLAISNVVAALKRSNPGLTYVCDPVMGDDGVVYIPEELIPVFRDQVIPIADIITPNQTELELLSGGKADTLENALKCVETLHGKGCKTVVISSIEFSNDVDKLFIIASHISTQNEKKQVMLQIPKLKAKFFGTGDLFSATFLAWITKTKGNLNTALENTVATVNAVITRTLNEYKGCSGDNDGERRGLELKLIQSKSDIEVPKVMYKCTEIKI